MKVLITGIAGFVGSSLAKHALEQGADVYGWVKPTTDTASLEELKNRIQLAYCDLCDRDQVMKSLEAIQPDRIFHMAAKSHIGESWISPQETLLTNITAQVNLLESVKKLNLSPRIQVAGSSEEYGLINAEDVPVNEETPLKPVSPYAVSKVAQDLMGLQYFNNYNIPIVRTRAFNQTGPGRSANFVTSAFAQQVARIEHGLQEPKLMVGNLEAIRDFTDVRDSVKAYWLALDQCTMGEVYNICSGEGVRIASILDILKANSEVDFEIQQDDAKMRPSDLPVLIGDGSKFKAQTGWVPKISFEESMQDLLQHWRNELVPRA